MRDVFSGGTMEAITFQGRSLPWVAAWLALSAALWGCGPVCVGTAGSCLALRVTPSDAAGATNSSRLLTVWLAGTDQGGRPITVAGTVQNAVSLPVELLIQPPSYLSTVHKISAQVFGPSQELALSGVTDLNWPLGTQIQAAVTVAPSALAFTRTADLLVGNKPSSVALLDADRDGIPDLAVASTESISGGGVVSLLLGHGDGTFASAQKIAALGSFGIISNLATADLNADGWADLTYADQFTDDIYLLLGKGNGSFQPAMRFYSSVNDPVLMSAHDLDGDGQSDLLVGGFDGWLGVLWNQGSASFATTTYLTTGGAPRWVAHQGLLAVADLNGDGLLDVVAVGIDFSSSITIWLNIGSRRFAPAATVRLISDGTVSVTAQDFDGDTFVDLAVMDSFFGGKVRFLKGDGQGHFADPQETSLNYDPSVAVGPDLNGDLIPDLVVTDLSSAGGSMGIHLALGNGAGGFSGVTCVSSVCQFPALPMAVVAQDLNRDQKLDLVLVTGGSSGSEGGVSILRNVSP